MNSIDIELTQSQVEQLESNGYDIDEFREMIANQPDFIKKMGAIDSISDLQAIEQGGCESGAYMPAVTYYTAKNIMVEYHSEIENIVSDVVDHFMFNPAIDGFDGFCVEIVSIAVECWVSRFNLEGVDWD